MPAHELGKSIEGLRIEGCSRKPAVFLRTKIINGMKYFVFKAEFNVSAEIVIELGNKTPKIDGNALVAKGETLGCDSALITTIAKTRTPPKHLNKLISHGSHTHGTNEWVFKEHTNVRVTIPRQEIINAIEKRKYIKLP